MRLTLRTLLAWLDDVLPAPDRQALGDKVAASPVAPRLIERIRRVVAQPGLSAPVPTGRGLTDDANSVAEYLDNTLPSDRLESFERICIESDLHLAEVAACHGLLAEVARNPHVALPLDEAGRQRLLGAMNHRSAVLAAAAQRRESRELAHMMRDDSNSQADTVLASSVAPGASPSVAANGQPATRSATSRKSSPAAWISAVVALTLLVALGALLARSIGGSNSGRRVAVAPAPSEPRQPAVENAATTVAAVPSADASTPVPSAGVIAPADDAAAKPEQAGTAAAGDGLADEDAAPAAPAASVPMPDPASTAVAANAPVAPPAAKPPDESAPPAVAAAPAGPSPPSVAAAQRVPQGDAMAIAAPVPGVGSPAAVATPAMAAVPAVVPTPAAADAPGTSGDEAAADPFAVGSVGADGLLLHKTDLAGQAAWARFPAGSPLGSSEELLVPPGFHPELQVRGVTIRLLPSTRATLTFDADGTPRIEVVFGRLVARAARADARLGVTVGRMAGTVTAGLVGGVAVSAELDRPPGTDPAVEPSRVHAAIFAVAGGVEWRQSGAGEPAAGNGQGLLEGIGPEGLLEARSSIEWESLKPGVVAVVPHAGLPDWIESGQRIDRVEKGACEALAAKAAATAPLTRALRELAISKRVENRMAAVATLALLGEFDELVELLCEDAPDSRLKNGQWSALETATVPLALSRGANAAAKLRKAFEDRGPHGKAEALQAMARGFSDEELAGGADAVLVEALDDPDLVVRRYAFKCLCDITRPSSADRLRYHADSLPDPRREGVNWWRSQLEKGLIRRGAKPDHANFFTPRGRVVGEVCRSGATGDMLRLGVF
jgi:hypothetical protein